MGKVCVCVVMGSLEHFPHIGANKHHRQHKVVRRSTKRSVMQSTYNLSRGWMMRRELRGEGFGGKSCYATMTCHRSISDDGPEGSKEQEQMMVSRSWFSERGFQSVVSQMVSQNMVSQSKNGFPKYGFSIKNWFPKIWFLNQNLVNYMFPNQTSAFSRYPATDSSKCIHRMDTNILGKYVTYGTLVTIR